MLRCKLSGERITENCPNNYVCENGKPCRFLITIHSKGSDFNRKTRRCPGKQFKPNKRKRKR